MYTTKVMFSELENRFDVGFYNPKALSLLRKLKSLSQKKNFTLVELGTLATLKKGIFYIPASEYREKGVPFIRVSNIKNLTIDINDLTYISDEWNTKEKKTMTMTGDLVISKGGTIGNVAIISEWLGNANISQDIIGVYVKDKTLSGYLAAFLRSKYGKVQMEKVKTQQTHAHLTLTPMRKLKILICETKKDEIAQKIKDACEYEGKMIDSINKAKEILHKAINIKIPKTNKMTFTVKCKDLESKFLPVYYYPDYLKVVNSLKKKFKTIKLRNISKIIKGDEVGSKNYKKEGIPFIRTSDFINYGIDEDSYHKLSEEIYKMFKQDLKPRDILFTNDGKIGISGMIIEGDKCIIQSHIRRIRISDKKFSPEFIFIFLNSDYGLYQIYRRIFIQSTISTIENELGDIEIPIIDKKSHKEITNLCVKAFEYKVERNKLIREACEEIEKEID